MFDFLTGGNKRRQRLLVATEDMRLEPATLPVEKGYVVDDKTREAWAASVRNIIPNRETSGSVMFVYEREAAPPTFLGKTQDALARREFKKNLNTIAKESLNDTLYELQRDSDKNKMASLLRFVILIVAVLAVVLVVAGLLMNGTLKLPF